MSRVCLNCGERHCPDSDCLDSRSVSMKSARKLLRKVADGAARSTYSQRQASRILAHFPSDETIGSDAGPSRC
jgi:hypothetical protein